MSLKSFIIGLALTGYGIATLIYNYQFTNFFGRSAFIESWFGSMYTFTKITSILASLVGLLFLVGLGDNLLDLITKPLQGVFSK